MNEITHVLESIQDKHTIEEFIKRQDINGCSILLDYLAYTNAETEKKWLSIYSDLFSWRGYEK